MDNHEHSNSKLYNSILEELNNPWEFYAYSDDELKQIAKDIYHNLIFTDRHINEYDKGLVTSIFMPFIFMGHINWPTDNTRESKIIRILLEDKEPEYKKRHNNYVNNVGLLFEYMDKGLSRSINGYPMFFSVSVMSIEQTERMFDFYNKYKQLMENLNEQF